MRGTENIGPPSVVYSKSDLMRALCLKVRVTRITSLFRGVALFVATVAYK